ncbi:flagellar hook-associated protein 1 FlgK [Thermovibrio guaymasensis]|uniref:Flagellar hook-associated protein 1 n=1 Tax=Thermovibrio guaymasensis TaxID=240167 RepID=A0A420W6Q4_9BACT|nr:flagellar hook-associated protein FlgK [Thermovibrio guaymasensis]RKQ61730.1 flagellar hook-associated protein 1 FlgK [Thermovibrio guaymasensis]
MSLFGALSIASQALLSNRIAVNSTTKNINNSYTEGYSREEPVFADVPGSGVSVEELRRVFSRALFKQYVSANQEREAYSQESTILSQIESVFNDATGSGFSEALNYFFSSLHDVALNPDDIAARESFLGAARTLIGRIRQSYSSLEEIGETYYGKLLNSVDRLNQLLKELSQVNKFIPLSKGSPTYNQYLDQRDKLIEEISSFIETKVTFNEDGTVNLYTAKGFALVLKDRAFKVSADRDSSGIHLKVNGSDISSSLKKGSIGGILSGIGLVEEWKSRLNKFTSVFAEKVNQQHKAGYDLYANKGGDLFTSDNGQPVDASNIVLAFDDPKKLAAASSTSNLNADNENVKALIALGQEKFSELNDLSFGEFYASEIVSALGSKVASVKNLYENSTLRFNAVKEKVKELSGVNVDEEMIKLTKFQKAYQAAARVVTVSDELLETVLGMVR